MNKIRNITISILPLERLDGVFMMRTEVQITGKTVVESVTLPENEFVSRIEQVMEYAAQRIMREVKNGKG